MCVYRHKNKKVIDEIEKKRNLQTKCERCKKNVDYCYYCEFCKKDFCSECTQEKAHETNIYKPKQNVGCIDLHQNSKLNDFYIMEQTDVNHEPVVIVIVEESPSCLCKGKNFGLTVQCK